MKKSRQITVIKWEVVQVKCYLCLNEKLEISNYRVNNMQTKNVSDTKIADNKTSTPIRSIIQRTDYCNFLFVKHIRLKNVG